MIPKLYFCAKANDIPLATIDCSAPDNNDISFTSFFPFEAIILNLVAVACSIFTFKF
mgnify:CR=1 FL=1